MKKGAIAAALIDAMVGPEAAGPVRKSRGETRVALTAAIYR